MKLARIPLFLLCIGTAHAAAPVDPLAESCDEIRTQIKAHAGVEDKPNTALLSKVGANPNCRFSGDEAFRAAWGDKPIPKDDQPYRRASQREHDDD